MKRFELSSQQLAAEFIDLNFLITWNSETLMAVILCIGIRKING